MRQWGNGGKSVLNGISLKGAVLNFKPLFQPETVAVIGVSTKNDRHPANVIYNKLHLRYPVKVYAVNPKGGELLREPVYDRIGGCRKRLTWP